MTTTFFTDPSRRLSACLNPVLSSQAACPAWSCWLSLVIAKRPGHCCPSCQLVNGRPPVRAGIGALDPEQQIKNSCARPFKRPSRAIEGGIDQQIGKRLSRFLLMGPALLSCADSLTSGHHIQSSIGIAWRQISRSGS